MVDRFIISVSISFQCSSLAAGKSKVKESKLGVDVEGCVGREEEVGREDLVGVGDALEASEEVKGTGEGEFNDGLLGMYVGGPQLVHQ